MTQRDPRPDGGPPALVDTHCHLGADAFRDEPVEHVLSRARTLGVTRVVTIGTDLAASRRAVDLAERHESVWATVGVDPNDLGTFDDGTLSALADLARSDRVVAIGEIGLDYHWDRAPRDVQKQAFLAQLELARELSMPVVVHSRSAHEDTYAILSGWASARHDDGPIGIMHCYSGDLGLAERLVEIGFLISLAGNVTYRTARDLHEVAAALSLDALVLETDSPYMTPQAHRGSRNEPSYLPHTAERVAGLRGIGMHDVARRTSANAERVFPIGVIRQ